MFESDEVDDDYFTPVAKTSLASIFKKPEASNKSDNETLKYTPSVPKPPENKDKPPKLYENIFSCVFDAYLWLDNVYTSKGKLGCAIVKHNTTQSFHSILLYDSKRATVSSAIAGNTLQVSVKGNDVISYYDQYGKYWYLLGSDSDVRKILDALKVCDVNIKTLDEEDSALPQQSAVNKVAITDTNEKIIESDTDSSINKKTKVSILNRMANMGQSVLPPRTSSILPSSDSDTNEDQIIAVRHKPVKHIVKKTVSGKAVSEHPPPEVPKGIVSLPQTEGKTFSVIDNQLQNSILMPVSGQELQCLFTEQRISNSEVRINMNRITDKVDCILDKVNNLEKDKSEGSNINNVILQKLLREYESKIKNYEELLQKRQNTNNVPVVPTTEMTGKDTLVTNLTIKVAELENCIEQKDDEILRLHDEYEEHKKINRQNDLQAGKENFAMNNEKFTKLASENEQLRKSYNDQLEHTIKNIMNETFRAIEANFDRNESYTGESIKNIVGTVIKKITIESLRNLK